jgi:hypothetical protein
MKYMLLFRPVTGTEVDVPPCKDLAAMGTLIGELTQSGILLATEGLHPSSKGARVRLAGGKLAVTDGPFTESKELIAGFALVQVKSKEAAVELAKRFLKVAGEGESEIREVME